MRKFIYILMTAALGVSMTGCNLNSADSMDGETNYSGSIVSSDTNIGTNVSDSTSSSIANSECNSSDSAVSSDTGDTNTDSSCTPSREYDNIYPQHEPYGTGIGAMPGRVVWAHDPDSVEWDGNDYWWDLNNFDESAILAMVNDSISSLDCRELSARSRAYREPALRNGLHERKRKQCGKSRRS